MIDKVSKVVNCLDFYKGKYVEIFTNDFSIQGKITSYSNHEYYFDVFLKDGKTKSKIALYYPFSIKFEKGVLYFDYRLKTLSKCLSSELVYNMSKTKNKHLFLD